MIHLDTPQFPLSDVAVATGFAPPTLRKLLSDKRLALGHDDINLGRQGVARLLTGRTAFRIAIISALHHAFGVTVSRANSYALRVTDIGHDGIDQATGKTIRELGRLYPQGRTILSVHPYGSVKVWNLISEQDSCGLIPNGAGVLHIDVTSIHENLEKQLKRSFELAA